MEKSNHIFYQIYITRRLIFEVVIGSDSLNLYSELLWGRSRFLFFQVGKRKV